MHDPISNIDNWSWILEQLKRGFSIEIEGRYIQLSTYGFYFVFNHRATPTKDNSHV